MTSRVTTLCSQSGMGACEISLEGGAFCGGLCKRYDHERPDYKAAYRAALAYIDACVCDPDITAKMRETWAELEKQRASVKEAEDFFTAP